MSDYLSTIVARSTGDPDSSAVRNESGAIRPRLPSLFEPTVAAPQTPIDEVSAATPTADARPERRRRPAPRFVVSPRTDIDPTAEATSTLDPEPRRHDLAPSIEVTASDVHTSEREESESIGRGDRVEGLSTRPMESDHGVAFAAPRNRWPEGSLRPRAESDQAIAESSTKAVEAETFESVPMAPRQMGTSRPAVVTAPRSEFVRTTREALVRSRGRANLSARSVRRTIRDSSEPDVADSPAIHVTIGRVEIRATVPPAPQNRRPSVQPGLSLEEYLGKPARGDR